MGNDIDVYKIGIEVEVPAGLVTAELLAQTQEVGWEVVSLLIRHGLDVGDAKVELEGLRRKVANPTAQQKLMDEKRLQQARVAMSNVLLESPNGNSGQTGGKCPTGLTRYSGLIPARRANRKASAVFRCQKCKGFHVR